MSVPAGLMQALQGGAASDSAVSPASITIPGPDAPTKGDGDWEQDLQAAIAALRELAGDATDHIEASTVDKCIAALSALNATRQKGAEAAFGVNGSHKAMSRAYGG